MECPWAICRQRAGARRRASGATRNLCCLPAAIVSLQEWNELTLQNPGEDSFKVRNFWLAVELADGRQVSSQVTRSVFTQPGTWPYAEGVGVPFGHEIRTVIRWPLTGP